MSQVNLVVKTDVSSLEASLDRTSNTFNQKVQASWVVAVQSINLLNQWITRAGEAGKQAAGVQLILIGAQIAQTQVAVKSLLTNAAAIMAVNPAQAILMIASAFSLEANAVYLTQQRISVAAAQRQSENIRRQTEAYRMSQ